MEANSVLNVLSLEDSPQDFEIIHELLSDAGYDLKMDRVDSEKDFIASISKEKYDVILADFKLPRFDALSALRLCNAVCPDVPFICVSGTIGEEKAVELLKAGAVDYVLKDRLERLPLAINRALHEAKEKELLNKTEKDLRENEHNYRILADSGQALVWTAGTDKLCNYFNRVWLDFTGRALEQELGNGWAEGVHPDDMQRCLDIYVGAFDRREKFSMEYRLRRHDGEYRWILDDGCPRYDSNGEFIGYIGHCLDITERKHAEGGQLIALQRLRRFIDSNIIGVVIASADGKVIETNDYYLNMIGFTRDEFESGKVNWLAITPPEWLQEDERAINELRERGSCAPYEKEYVRQNGTRVSVLLTDTLLPGPEEQIAAFALDITDQKRSEDRERHLNATLKSIRNVNKLITKEKNRDRLITECCNILTSTRGIRSAWITLLDKFGKPSSIAESGLGGALFPLKSILERGHFPKCARMALAGPEVVVIKDVVLECPNCAIASFYKGNAIFCVRLEMNGNTYGLFSISVSQPFVDDPQEHSLFMEIAEDIAFALYNIELEEKRERIKAELAESEARYRSLFEGAAEGILIVENRTGKIKYANQSFSRMTGYDEAELKSMTSRDIHTQEVLKDIVSEIEEQLSKGLPITQTDIPVLKKDGTVIYSDVVTSADVLIDGASCSAAFFIDCSKRKKAEDEKKKLESQLWQAQKMEAVGRLSGGVAHDFNNILTIIIGNAEMAMMGMGKEERLWEPLKSIREAGGRAAILTRQLLAFSRRQVFQAEIFNLDEVVHEIEKMIRRLIGEDIELEMHLSENFGMVETDRGQVEQIIMNLAVNARDAMPNGGKLTLETESVELDEEYAHSHIPMKPGSYEMLAISDTGTGMTEEIKAHIFEPFFTTKEKGKGTGLGLSIVYGIVKQSNGYIWVYSEPGKGTSFKIYFPRSEKEPASRGRLKMQAEESFKGSETILVVEDDNNIRDLIEKTLTMSGYKILCASNGGEAINVTKDYKGKIDLLLTDVIMPVMGGKELANLLMTERPDIRILYMSGYTDNAIVHHGVLDKGLFFIQKPFTSVGLKKKVREVLGVGN